MQKLRRMIALSTTFQTRSGLNYSNLYARGQYCTSIDFGNLQRPYFVIWCQDPYRRMVSGGEQNFLLSGGRLDFMVEIDPLDSLTTRNDKTLEAHDFFANLMKDIAGLAAVDDAGNDSSHVDINEISIASYFQPPLVTEEQTGLFFCAWYTLSWGFQA